jgi:type I restriction enzyme, S subunit
MKRQAYPKCKSSSSEWLENVPQHWDVKRGRFCTRVNPPTRRIDSLESDEEVSFVPMEAIGERGGIDLQRTVQLDDVAGGYTEFENGDVIVAKITPCFENGKGALAEGLLNGVALGTTELHVLRALPGLERRYLFYLTISWGYRKAGEAEMYGAGGQKRVPSEFCKDYRTPFPPLSEQTAIANFLDRETSKIDGLIAKKSQLIKKLAERRNALISRALTRGLTGKTALDTAADLSANLKPSGVLWLGDVPAHWSIKKLGHHVDLFTGYAFESENFSFSEGVPLVRGDNVTEGRLRWGDKTRYWNNSLEEFSAFQLRAMDVLIGMDGSKVGKNYAMVIESDLPLLLVQRVARLRVDRSLNAHYLYYLIGSQLFQTWVNLTKTDPAIPHISPHDIRAFPVALPPIHEQQFIANYLQAETGKLDILIANTHIAIDRMKEYRVALITEAVAGKFDVRKVAA